MAGFIMAGRIQAAIFVVLSTLISLIIPPLVIFSNAAIALITLRQGWQQGIIYTVLASITLLVVSTVARQGMGSGFIAGLMIWLLIVILASVLAMTKSWSKTLQLVLLLGSVGVLLFHLIHPDVEAYWKPVLEQFKSTLTQSSQLTKGQIDQNINLIAGRETGLLAATIVLFSVTSLIIARNWQALLYNPGGFGKEFREIFLGKPFAVAFIAVATIAILAKSSLLADLRWVGIAVFMFQGLSLIHAMVKQQSQNIGMLIGLYVMMFLLFVPMIVLLATLGIIDNFVNVRQKIAGNKT